MGTLSITFPCRPQSRAGRSTLPATFEFLGLMQHLQVTLAIARRAGRLRRDLQRRGLTFQLTDMLIAATALEQNLWLATDNERDFRETGVKLVVLA